MPALGLGLGSGLGLGLELGLGSGLGLGFRVLVDARLETYRVEQRAGAQLEQHLVRGGARA